MGLETSIYVSNDVCFYEQTMPKIFLNKGMKGAKEIILRDLQKKVETNFVGVKILEPDILEYNKTWIIKQKSQEKENTNDKKYNDLDKGCLLNIKKKFTKDLEKPLRLEKENFWKKHQILQHLNEFNYQDC